MNEHKQTYVANKKNTGDNTEWSNYGDRITSPFNFRRADPRLRNTRMDESSTELLIYWWGISALV